MKTQILQYNADSVQLAQGLIMSGEIVAIPTETVYGLAASSFDSKAVKKIFEAKGRPQDNPLISHISSLDMLEMTSKNIPKAAYILAQKFWPGPLTMVLPRSKYLADEVCAGLDTAAVRMPMHKAALDIINACKVPIAAPSANNSGGPSPTTAQHVYNDMNGKISLIIDGGACEVGVESTVVSLCEDVPVLLRPGRITLEQIEQVLCKKIVLSKACLNKLEEKAITPSPGMKYKHYSPKANIILIRGTLNNYLDFLQDKKGDNTYRLGFVGEEQLCNIPCVSYGHEYNSNEQEQRLFCALRELDDLNAQTVYARCPLNYGEYLAVYNRILRAAAFNIIDV